MKSINNISKLILTTIFLIVLSGCRGCGYPPGVGSGNAPDPPCKRYNFGWVTFSNLTKHDMWITINYNNIPVPANTNFTVNELSVGEYDYTASYKRKKRKRGSLQVCRCTTTVIELPSEGYTPCGENIRP